MSYICWLIISLESYKNLQKQKVTAILRFWMALRLKNFMSSQLRQPEVTKIQYFGFCSFSHILAGVANFIKFREDHFQGVAVPMQNYCTMLLFENPCLNPPNLRKWWCCPLLSFAKWLWFSKKKFCSLPMYYTYTILYYTQILLVLEKDRIGELESEAKKSRTVL